MERSEIERKLQEYICTELLDRPDFPLAADEPLMSGGILDSFCLAHIAVFIELNFGVVIPDAELTVENFDTLTQLAARVAAG